jgi:predicted ATP-dependent endonuclease of OLD family
MIYKSFRIINYKGVRDTIITIPNGNSNAVTFIGLNESGKTTLLEAIYSFSPDRESQPLFIDNDLLPDAASKIPRDKFFSFTDEISVTATVELLSEEKSKFISDMRSLIGEIDPDTMPNLFTIKDCEKYENSVLKKATTIWQLNNLRMRSGRQKNWRKPSVDEWSKIISNLKNLLPSIAYFPTFLSQVPNKIYLKHHDDDKSNSFYRTIFQDILYQIGTNYTIETQILDRLVDKKDTGILSQIISAFWGSPKRGMVQQLIDKASSVLSKVITDRWNEIFKTRPAGREIVINFGLDENEDQSDVDPYIEFAIRDGSNRFNIADRSLGFRWFFCFLLFTQFRAKRQGGVGTLFLFDEPASNLHAKAQEKLLDSFREVTLPPNRLIYSTHSPYMIDPIWLDDAYVIENSMISGELTEIGEMSVSEESDIVALKYKSYVDKFPDRVNHFQPVLDRLEVKPSIGEISEKSLLVEGKSDYAILRGLLEGKATGFKIIPAHGATTLGSLVGLLRGWSWDFSVMLDSDREGRDAATKYAALFGLEHELIQLKDIGGSLVEIENLLSEKDKEKISKSLNVNEKITKKHIYQFFVNNANNIKSFNFDGAKSDDIKRLIVFVENSFK